jgi:hypothetical protein
MQAGVDWPSTINPSRINRVMKNKHQAVSHGRYKLEARGLRLEA